MKIFHVCAALLFFPPSLSMMMMMLVMLVMIAGMEIYTRVFRQSVSCRDCFSSMKGWLVRGWVEEKRHLRNLADTLNNETSNIFRFVRRGFRFWGMPRGLEGGGHMFPDSIAGSNFSCKAAWNKGKVLQECSPLSEAAPLCCQEHPRTFIIRLC